MPKISIVLPTYNGEKYIKLALDSILSQTESDWELIIVNDCSTDSTREIVEDYSNRDKRITVINNEVNKKVAASLNIGFKLAKGKYFTWTSDDNLMKPNALLEMLKYFNEHEDVDFVSFGAEIIDEHGEVTGLWKRKTKPYYLICSSNIGACFLYSREIANKIGPYDESLPVADDYDFWCRAALAGNMAYSEEPLYQYRRHGGALSSTHTELVHSVTLKIIEQYKDALFEKYDIPYSRKTYVFYKLWTVEMSNVKYLVKTLLRNPFYIFRAMAKIIKTM